VALELWRGIAVPKGTPKPVIAALEGAIRKVVASKEFAEAREARRPARLPVGVRLRQGGGERGHRHLKLMVLSDEEVELKKSS